MKIPVLISTVCNSVISVTKLVSHDFNQILPFSSKTSSKNKNTAFPKNSHYRQCLNIVLKHGDKRPLFMDREIFFKINGPTILSRIWNIMKNAIKFDIVYFNALNLIPK